MAVMLEEAARALHRDHVRCGELLARAEAAAHVGRRDPVANARLQQLRGDLLATTGDWTGAVRAYQAARSGWLAVGRQQDALEAMLGRSRVMVTIGEYDDVLSAVGRIQATLDEASAADEKLTTRLHVLAHQQLGDARAGRGEHDIAHRHYDLAEDLARVLGDGHEVAEVALRRGSLFLLTGLLHRAIDELRRARRQFLEVRSVVAAARTVLPIAAALSASGEAVVANEILDRVAPQLAGNAPALAELDLVRAAGLLRSGLVAEAHARAAEAGRVFGELGMMERAASTALLSGAASQRLRRMDDAAAELAAADQLYAECGARAASHATRLLQARVAFGSGDHAAAVRIARRLIGEDRNRASSLAVRARLLVARATDDLDLAESMITAASEVAGRLGLPELRLELRLARARLLRRQGRRVAAVGELRRAHELGLVWAGRAPDRTSGSGDSPLAEVADELIGMLLDQGGHAAHIEAWQRASAAKSAVLSPLSARTRGWLVEGAAMDIDDLVAAAHFRSATPARGTHAFPSVSEGPLVDYYVFGSEIVAFVIREGQVHVRRLPGAADETRKLVAAWHQECVLLAATRHHDAGASSPALEGLFERLVVPLADLLADLESEPLAVVAHRHLQAVPFDALLDVAAPWRARVAPGGDPDDADLHDVRRALPASVLVLAVPDDNAPAITDEARMIQETLPGADVHVGRGATAGLLAERARGADLVHLAAHGIFLSGNPLFSAVRLGDGWLRAADLLDGRFDFGGSVVVLSACGSGRSSDRTSEALGLAWACLAAGAGGVVAALWAVDDEVTLELMSHLYQRLAAGDHPQVALGRARRRIAERRPHPYYWAAFRYFTLPAT